jgi:pimeloyl-ACP methyl ester carboxylesterase
MVYRSRFKEIVFEFTVPEQRQKGIVILLNGLPSVPKLNDLLERLAANGYLAVFPRYKGTWESSGKFLAKSPVKDVIFLCNELIGKKKIIELHGYKEFKLETKNLILIGTSFGGAIALCAAILPTVKKVIALSPIVNWKTYAGAKTIPASKHMQRFLRKGFGEGYRFTDIGWKKFETGLLFNPSTNLTKSVAKKITIVYDKSDKTTLAEVIIGYGRSQHIILKEMKGVGHISFSRLSPRDLIKLLK